MIGVTATGAGLDSLASQASEDSSDATAMGGATRTTRIRGRCLVDPSFGHHQRRPHRRLLMIRKLDDALLRAAGVRS
jgi:hypothetical protein